MKRLAAAAVASAVLFGCTSPGGPADAYRAFTAAVRTGDADQAWARLSEASHAMLDARAKAVAARAGGASPATGKDLVLGDASARSRGIEEVLVVREAADAAVVRVAVRGGGDGEVSLVRERGAWRVVLPILAPDRE